MPYRKAQTTTSRRKSLLLLTMPLKEALCMPRRGMPILLQTQHVWPETLVSRLRLTAVQQRTVL